MYPQRYQEFLDFLDSNPEYLHDMRVRLLTPDLIALPEQFAQMVATLAEFTERFTAFAEATGQRLTGIEQDLATLKEDVATIKEDVGTLKEDVGTLKEDVATIKEDVGTLKEDVGTLKEDVATIKEDVGTLKEDVGTLKEDVATIKEDVGTLKEDVGTLKEDVATIKEDVGTLKEDVGTLKEDVATIKEDVGTLKSDVATLKTSTGTLVRSDLERRAREIILNIARDELGLTKGRILVARGKDTAPAFLESIEGAEEDGLITEKQEGDVLFADIIIRARRTHNKEYVHAAFEVSRTIRNNDIERAAERAAAVTAATGQETIAAVIGERIQPPQQALAEQTGVRVILPEVFRQNEEDEALAA